VENEILIFVSEPTNGYDSGYTRPTISGAVYRKITKEHPEINSIRRKIPGGVPLSELAREAAD
jgi:hypothetical protein